MRGLTEGSAAKLASDAHRGELDKSGQPYILHPARVANNIKRLIPNPDPELLMAAWLHDVIEDCSLTAEDLIDLGFSRRTVDAAKAVSKPEDDERSYDEVITDLIALGNRDALLVKVADNMDNLHPERTAIMESRDQSKALKLREK